MLSTYLDGSGSVSDSSGVVLSLGGYLGTDEQWRRFVDEWQCVLDAYGVPALHMKDFAHSRKAFAAWKGDEKRRASFLSELSAVIHGCHLEGFVYSVNTDHYREINKHLELEESLPPYALAALWSIARITEWHRRNRPDDELVFFIEEGDAGQPQVRHKFDTDSSLADIGVLKPIFSPKAWTENGVTRYCLPYQAADYLAYETAKMLTDWIKRGKTRVRESIFSLMREADDATRIIAPTNGYLEASHIVEVAKRWRVQPRRAQQ